MRRGRAVVTSLMAVALAGACLGACKRADDGAAKEKAPETEAVEAEDEAAKPARAVGTIDDNALEFVLENGTGVPVSVLQVRGAGSMDFGADLLSGKAIEDGEEVLLRLPANWAGVDLSVTLGPDASTTVLAGVSVTSPARMRLMMAGEGPCLSIEREDGTTEVVEAAAEEPAVAEEAPVAEEPAEVGEVAVEEPAAPETTYTPMGYGDAGDAPEVYEPVMPEAYVETAPVEYEVPMEAPAATEQTEDSCIDDVMLKPTV